MSTRKLVVTAMCMVAAGFAADHKLTVVVFDYVGTPGAILKNAAETARRAFRAAGVESDWNLCRVSKDPHEVCTLPPAGTYMEVKIVPRAMEGLKSGDALGLALIVRGQRSVASYAFYEPVKALAESSGQIASVVLACVMSHEIGHLMGMPHSPSGIMKERFLRRDLIEASAGRLYFTPEDTKTLRAALR